MPEISDADLAVLNGSKQLLDKLLREPKTQLATQKLIKQAIPTAEIQTIEDNPIYQELQNTQQQLRELRTSLDNQRVDSQLDNEFKELRDHRFYQDEGIAAVKKFMVDRRIPSPIDAADAWERQNPPKPIEKPTGYSSDSWNFGAPAGNDEDLKLLYHDDDAWLEKETRKVFQEFAEANRIRV
jgi:hypothetical protein